MECSQGQPSQPAGQKSTHTGSFFFHWPEELSTIGSSISLSGNLHPQITSRNFPLYTSGDRTSRFRESGGQAPCLSISKTRKQSTLDLFLANFGFLLIAISGVAMSSNSSPRLPKPELPKLRCARKVDFSTALHSIGISDFAISRILMRRFRDFTPRNPEMVNEIDFFVDSAPPVRPADSYGPHAPFGPSGLHTS
jgi:hypothetical protein